MIVLYSPGSDVTMIHFTSLATFVRWLVRQRRRQRPGWVGGGGGAEWRWGEGSASGGIERRMDSGRQTDKENGNARWLPLDGRVEGVGRGAGGGREARGRES